MVLVLFTLLGVVAHFTRNSDAAAPPAEAKHGLTGNYYVGSGGWYKDTLPATGGFLQIWTDQNDFSLPRTFTAPAATRVDPQVAFGQGKGFNTKSGGPPVVWWPTGFALPPGWTNPNAKPWDQLAAVIWKGYIRLPKAGTYYFGVISNGPSAVYLNQARVALGGLYGGVLVSDAFAYPKEDMQNFVQNLQEGRENVVSTLNPGQQYVVPVSIDAPRDFPIEVHYNPSNHFTHWGSEPFGIDLFWVTPDSRRDDKGKLIASIVPSDVLYSEAPGPIEKPTVRSANSTTSADFLYFPAQGAEGAVRLAIRLADKDGNPVSGKRVYVNSLNEWNPDSIVQPDKPTDKNGETTAKICANAANPVAHDSAIFATDVTDLVDVAQVAHVTFQQQGSFFFPDSFSPYYDPNIPSIEPLPLRVGHPVTIKAPIVNRNKFTVEVTVTFSQNAWNIGASGWSEIGSAKDVRLQSGEHKDVSITWTPEQTTGHICFRVDVSGHMLAAAELSGNNLVASLLPTVGLPTMVQAQNWLRQQEPLKDSRQKNLEGVAPTCPLRPPPVVGWENLDLGRPCSPEELWPTCPERLKRDRGVGFNPGPPDYMQMYENPGRYDQPIPSSRSDRGTKVYWTNRTVIHGHVWYYIHVGGIGGWTPTAPVCHAPGAPPGTHLVMPCEVEDVETHTPYTSACRG